MITKNIPLRIEFGEYGNYGTLIPLKIVEVNKTFTDCAIILWGYPNSDRTIELCHDLGYDDIDWESFGLNKEDYMA